MYNRYMLTDRSIKNIKPTSKHQFIADGSGLYLRVHPSGKKQFLYRSRVGGKASWVPLGDYPTMSLLDARNACSAQGAQKLEFTLSNLFDDFYKHVTTQYKNPEAVKSKFDLNIRPLLGSKRVSEVSRADVSDALQKIIDRGAPVMANRVLADMKHMFNFGVSRGVLDSNPLAVMTRKNVGGRERPRERALSNDEISDFIKMLKTSGMDVKTKTGLILVLLTGQRSGEVVGIKKSEIHGAWWHIPADRTKANRAHKVYLNIQARAILKHVIGLFGDSPLDIDPRTMAKALRRKQVDFTPHDLRRTLATRLSDLGVMPHVIEKMLNHQMEGVMAVYNRAEYLQERKEAWQLWGRHISAIRRSTLPV